MVTVAFKYVPQGPNQQRGHLPSLLSLSFFNGSNQRIYIGDRRDTVPGTAPPCVFQTFAADRAGRGWVMQGGAVPSITDRYSLGLTYSILQAKVKLPQAF